MLTDLADGSRDAVLIYHVDRLTRRPIELEQFLDVVTAAKVRHVKLVSGGDLNMGSWKLAHGDLVTVRCMSPMTSTRRQHY